MTANRFPVILPIRVVAALRAAEAALVVADDMTGNDPDSFYADPLRILRAVISSPNFMALVEEGEIGETAATVVAEAEECAAEIRDLGLPPDDRALWSAVGRLAALFAAEAEAALEAEAAAA